MENLDIKDFQSVSSVSELDNILLVQSTGVNGKMTVALFKTAVRNDVTPSIKENVWWIGTVNTGIVAAGKTPEFRKGDLGIEWKYTTDTAWKLLVNYESISLTFDDLTEAQKNSLKLHFSDLTGAEIAQLQQPARDMIATLQATNTSVTDAENLRVEAEEKRKTDTAAAIKSATDAAGAANTAAKNVQDGKTPAFEIGTVQQGTSASAAVTANGTDASGNPKYRINLTLPKGDKGDNGKTPVFEIGTVSQGSSASASVTANGTDSSGNPKYKINLTLPKGDKGNPGTDGEDGKTPSFEIGTVDKGESASATVTANGTDSSGNPKYRINLTLPKGDKGNPGTDGEDGTDGKTPVLEFGTVATGNPGTQASATLTANGTTAEGNPKYLLSLTIPRGDKGLPGEGSGNVSASGTGLVAGKKYLFVPSSNGSTEGSFVEYAAPTIPEQVQPDWNATSGKGAILHKPTIPAKVSQLTNDSNFVSKSYVDDEIDKIPTPDVSAQIGAHNTSGTAHADIRTLITNYLSTAKGYTDTQISALIGTAPEILDTLGELAAAVLNNQDAVTAINNAIAQKLGKTEAQNLYVALQGYVAYSQAEKTKLAGIAAGANKITVDSSLSGTSTNPVQNKVINTALAGKAASSHTHTKSQIVDFPTIPTDNNQLANGAGYLTDAPDDNKQYGRKNGAWSEVVAGAGGGVEYYDINWLLDMYEDGNCTQEQYDGLLDAVQNNKYMGFPTFSMVGDDSIISLSVIIGLAVQNLAGASVIKWVITPSLQVESSSGDILGGRKVDENSSTAAVIYLRTDNFPVAVNPVTLNVSMPESENSADEYIFQFTSGISPTVLTMPAYIKWVNEPVIEANKTYQVSIVNKIAVIGGVE
ncbi:phage neck protein fibritin [Bacteroides thetaiotaomicron]|jgi:hypothetical protein|uniref:phage neck protein fibritin n=1 Tax=Bacteroides thetaiotaomicron TaxID=818 RepID=UPI000E4DD471|nr:phage neck protein fibritin [Bacteroides thetaiotaomicron]RHI48324.1 hypothetical protein DW167_01695 [Bacteroides thetaiotaomicron]DAG14129.1 MAG TPA: Fibritin C-terminal region [Caudoviricetes sp.]DAQ86496.1 MAG TPA: Fibritin C-terminal region [Caudoviricetes sp.]DAV75151.1 MAG TPA: Fibritin C-terminal region [Caudoviricetes sp.]